ncbi:integrase_H2C2 domain-containing protein [Trichonephila inaurata madagascariensis]|uniref:Integrase_H2C2 domain-containing protein n=1 Tax=Trichonephila inaurata madagascariensis TaxID=2747483 RepID=A0A8X7CD29_9ARAC|nr:integrase_H2C2 domain-containing protein [Trichonephila inaurata madagascariensis]
MQAFKDEDGLLRIRTKLADSYEKEDFKFPILLPASDVVVKLIREEHVKAMHAGSSILLAWLREKFWIIRAKRLVKRVLSESVICKRYKAKHVEVPFAPLPRDRVTQTKIFEVTGVYYAGPLYLKSKAKAWIVLLTYARDKENDALEVGDVLLIGHDNVQRIDWPLGVVLEVCPGKDGVPRVARVRTSHGERIRPFQRLYPLEVSAKTEISVLKASGKVSLPVEKTPESSTDHVSDSPTDYAPDSPIESTHNSEEKPPTKTRLARTIKIPRKVDL